MTVGRTDSAVERITRIVAAETGLRFRSGRADTEAGVRRAMAHAQVSDLEQFVTLLETGQASLDDLIGELAVGETYFFRDSQHFELIRSVVFPDVLARRGPTHSLRIWSAGCATGEEAYSLAVTLIDAGIEGDVLATDLSRRALQRARAATYRRWSLRGLDVSLIRRCFHEIGDQWRLDERFRTPVTFEFHNLARGVYPSVPGGIWGMDLILCRNVLIYLDPETIRRVACGFAETLTEGGWLITGPSDPPLQGLTSLSPVVTPHGVAYRKKSVAGRTAGARFHGEPASGQTGEAAALVAGTVSRFRVVNGIPCALGSVGPTGDEPVPDAQRAFAAGEYARVLDLTQSLGDVVSAALRIRAMASQNGAASALKELGVLVERFPVATELHLLRAILRIELSQIHEATQSLRQTLYLDRTLIIAHFLLATVRRRHGDLQAARLAYRNVRDLAMARPPDEPLPLADGERAGTIAAIASAELALIDARQAEAS